MKKFLALLLAMTMVLTALFDYDGILGTVGYYAAGIIFFFQAVYRLFYFHIYGTLDSKLMRHVRSDDGEYSHTLVGTAGVLSFSILSMILCYYVLDGSHSSPFYVMKLILSLVVLIFAFYAMNHGVFSEGFLMLGISINIALFSVMHLFHLLRILMLNYILFLF